MAHSSAWMAWYIRRSWQATVIQHIDSGLAWLIWVLPSHRTPRSHAGHQSGLPPKCETARNATFSPTPRLEGSFVVFGEA